MVALVAAVSVVLGGVVAPRAGAATPTAAKGPVLSLVDQSPWVKPTPPGSPKTFTLDVAARPGTPATDEVVVTLYDLLTTRSGFEQTLKTTPTKGILDQTHPVALSSMPVVDGGSALSISVLPDPTATPAPAAGTPTLDLHCVGTGTCTGVYPLVVSLVRPSTGGKVANSTFTTYLTYSTEKSAHQLDFAWVVPIAAPVTIRSGERDPAKAVAAPSRATTASLAGLVATLGAKSNVNVPVTVAASPQTLQALGGRGAQAVQQLAAMSSADQPTRQFLAQPYVPIDLGALAGAGEGEEITAQIKLGASVLRTLKVQATSKASTWVATGTVGSDLRTGMSKVGASSLVVPDADLAAPRDTDSTWASAFTMSLGKGAPVTGAVADSELAAHFTADPGDPALEANQLLADLAMIHFELPNTTTPRGVVAVPPAGWTPTKAFDSELLAGLATNPVVQATTLDGYFSAFSKVLGSATPPTRRLQSGGTGPVLAPSLARRITAARLRLTDFDRAVPGKPAAPVLGQLDQLLLAAESDDLVHAGQVAGLDTFGRALDGQLSQVQLATERTITLTARTGLIPVTIISSATYTVVGTLSLSGGRFVFPHGSTRPLKLNHNTTPVRVDVEARTSGDLPLEVSFRSPTGHLLIAAGQLTVRSTATSLVGVVLTVLALLVLLGWWARTWRAGRRRRASQARGASGP